MSDTLFDVPDPEPIARVSSDRRRTLRQATAVANRVHPLALALGWHIGLHIDASTDRDGPGPRCGDCRFRSQARHHNRTYAKCTFGATTTIRPTYDGKGTWEDTDYPRMSHGAGTDTRGWWPACPDHELGDKALGPDASRWAPR